MPTLQPHIGGQNYRMTQRPADTDIGGATRGLISTIGNVIDHNQKVQIAEDQNKLDRAVLATKNDLLLQNEQQAKNPTAEDEGWHEEQTAQIVENNSANVPPHLQFAFKEKTQLGVTASNVIARANRTKAVNAEGVALLDQNLLLVAGTVPKQFQDQEISEQLMVAGAKGFINAADANKKRTEAWNNIAGVDASGFNEQGEPMFDEVMAKVADLKDPTYPLEPKDREKLYSKLKKQKKMVLGEREDTATSALVGIWGKKVASGETLEMSDIEPFLPALGNTAQKSWVGIVNQSKKDARSELRTGTRFDRENAKYWKEQAKIKFEDMQLPDYSPIQQSYNKGTLTKEEIENSNLPDAAKEEMGTIAGELERLQKFEDARIEQESAVGQLNAQLHMYGLPALLDKLSNDPLLKPLDSSAKQAILKEHADVISKGQGFRYDKSWQASFADMQSFANEGGFVGGYVGLTEKEKQRAMVKNADLHNDARRNFLQRSEFAYRNKKSDPTGSDPDYFMFKEHELRDARTRQLKTTFGDIVRAAIGTSGSILKLEKEGRADRSWKSDLDEFAQSAATEAFRAYRDERIRLNQPAENKEQKPQEAQNTITEKPEERMLNGKLHIKVEGGWLPKK